MVPVHKEVARQIHPRMKQIPPSGTTIATKKMDFVPLVIKSMLCSSKPKLKPMIPTVKKLPA